MCFSKALWQSDCTLDGQSRSAVLTKHQSEWAKLSHRVHKPSFLVGQLHTGWSIQIHSAESNAWVTEQSSLTQQLHTGLLIQICCVVRYTEVYEQSSLTEQLHYGCRTMGPLPLGQVSEICSANQGDTKVCPYDRRSLIESKHTEYRTISPLPIRREESNPEA